MARLTQSQTRARSRLADIATLGATPHEAATQIADALGVAIGWDGFRLFGVDPETRLINRVLAASAGDDASRDEWLRDVYLKAERYDLGFIELETLMRARLAAVAFQGRLADCHGFSDEMLRGRSETEFHAAFVRNQAPVGGTILASFSSGDRWVASMQAYRRDRGRPFRAGDVAFIRLVSARIGDILAAALSREAALAAGKHPSAAAGVVVLERSGQVRFATPAGEAWIDALRAIPGEARTRLPSAVWGTMAGLSGERARVVNAARLPGGLVTIEATPGGPDGSVALIIAPNQDTPGIVPPARWALTPAEERVAALVVQGHGNRAVADRLSISMHTVEWHLRHIFDRLGVRSRAQLTARYFQDTALPTLTADRTIVPRGNQAE